MSNDDGVENSAVPYLFETYRKKGQAMDIAKLFWPGRSQAVRLPKEFRMDASEVRIRRHGQAIIFEPVPKDWAWLDAIAGTMSGIFTKIIIKIRILF